MVLAGSLAADGFKVIAFDADPTQAFSRWVKNAYEGPPVQTFAEADETRLAHLRRPEGR